MAKELTDIIKAAAEVRDETAMQQNTATRVGGVLTDLAQFVGEAVFAAGMTAKANTAGVSLLIKYYDADGQPYTKELPLPVASLLRAGVLTPAQLADLNTADRNETTARQASDAELLRRIQGKSTSSSAYSDPCINLGDLWVILRGTIALKPLKYRVSERFKVLNVKIEHSNCSMGHFAWCKVLFTIKD